MQSIKYQGKFRKVVSMNEYEVVIELPKNAAFEYSRTKTIPLEELAKGTINQIRRKLGLPAIKKS